jgi:hypothetical protein
VQDDLTIPSPTYRVPRQPRGMDPATRKLAMIAGGIGVGLVVLVGGWHMIGHHSDGVPVVQAEPGPLRVKPTNPGGMHVAGLGNDIFSGGSDTNVRNLAPAPQTPDPQALQAMAAAQRAAAAKAQEATAAAAAAKAQAATAAAAAAKAQAATAAVRAGSMPVGPQAAGDMASGSVAAGPAAASPAEGGRAAASRQAAAFARVTPQGAGAAPEAAAPRPEVQALARPAVAPRPMAPQQPASAPARSGTDRAAGHGPVMVQLAALASEQAARTEWRWAVARWPALLGRFQPVVSRITRDGHVFWRLRTGGFADHAAAAAFCARLRAVGGACSVADF